MKFDILDNGLDDVLIWNVRDDTQYVVRLQGPNGIELGMATYFHEDGDSIIGFLTYECDEDCEFKNTEIHKELSKEEGNIVHYFYARNSIADGSLISNYNMYSSSEPGFNRYICLRRMDRNRKYFLNSQGLTVFRDRKLLEPTCSSLLPTAQWTCCYFDMKDDKFMLLKHILPASSESLLSSSTEVRSHAWKNVIHFYRQLSSRTQEMWAVRFGADMILKDYYRKEGRNVYGMCRLYYNDMFLIEMAGNHLIVRWFDKLAYSKARKSFDEFP